MRSRFYRIERAAVTGTPVGWERAISDHVNNSVAVCICTFRRPDGLRRLLDGLDAQQFSLVPTPSVVLIVVDNSPEGGAASTCQSHQGAWPLHYVHETRPGISHARNAALAAVPADTDFVAMIDDDEVPAPTWLDCLLNAQVRSGADVIVGPAIPLFPEGTPAWIRIGEIFYKPTNMFELRDLDPDPSAATCNVLVRASALLVEGVEFDPALALCGGEDKMLFQLLKRRGFRFAWAADATVHEWVPAERATLAYLWRESFRRGTVKYYVKRKLKSTSPLHSARIGLRMVLLCITSIAWDCLRLLASAWRGRLAWIPHLLRIADGLGMIAGVLRIPNRHYRPQET